MLRLHKYVDSPQRGAPTALPPAPTTVDAEKGGLVEALDELPPEALDELLASDLAMTGDAQLSPSTVLSSSMEPGNAVSPKVMQESAAEATPTAASTPIRPSPEEEQIREEPKPQGADALAPQEAPTTASVPDPGLKEANSTQASATHADKVAQPAPNAAEKNTAQGSPTRPQSALQTPTRPGSRPQTPTRLNSGSAKSPATATQEQDISFFSDTKRSASFSSQGTPEKQQVAPQEQTSVPATVQSSSEVVPPPNPPPNNMQRPATPIGGPPPLLPAAEQQGKEPPILNKGSPQQGDLRGAAQGTGMGEQPSIAQSEPADDDKGKKELCSHNNVQGGARPSSAKSASVKSSDGTCSTTSNDGAKESGLSQDSSAVMKVLTIYSKRLVKVPCCFIFLYAILIVAVCAALYQPKELDTDFGSFMRADGDSSRYRDCFISALKFLNDKDGNSRRLNAVDMLSHSMDSRASKDYKMASLLNGQLVEEFVDDPELVEEFVDDPELVEEFVDAPEEGESRHLSTKKPAGILFFRFELHIIYQAKEVEGGGAASIFTEQALRDIKSFENHIRTLPGWQRICANFVYTKYKKLCEPGESLANFIWASVNSTGTQDQEDAKMVNSFGFNGKGKYPIPLDAACDIAQSDTKRGIEWYLPKGATCGNLKRSGLQLMQSHFTFLQTVGFPKDKKSLVNKRVLEAKERYAEFLEAELFPAFIEKEDDYESMRIYYSGGMIDEFQIWYTLTNDALFAIGSIAMVFSYMWFHTRSFALSLLGLLIIFSSVPVAAVITPSKTMTIASFLSIFLIVGIGSDVIFVFNDFWNQSKGIERNLDHRLAWTLKQAGKSSLVTTCTTSASFFANLASVLRPLREFGFFMGLCVICSYILSLMFYPSLVILNEKYGHKCSYWLDTCRGRCSLVAQKCKKRKSSKAVHPGVEAPTGALALTDDVSRDPWALPPQPEVQDSTVQRALLFWMDLIAPRKLLILAFTIILVLIFIISTALMVEVDPGLPDIFPPDHNQNHGQQVRKHFSAWELVAQSPPRGVGKMCGVMSREPECLLHWCWLPEPEDEVLDGKIAQSVTVGDALKESGPTCQCFRHPESIIDDSCKQVIFGTRFVGLDDKKMLQNLDFQNKLSQHIKVQNKSVDWLGLGLRSDWLFNDVIEHPDLVLEDWYGSGNALIDSLHEGVTTMKVKAAPGATKSCRHDSICFCSEQRHRCELMNWNPMGSIVVPPSRFLAEDEKVEEAKLVQVAITFGLKPPDVLPLLNNPDEMFRFDENFEPANPWSQRALYAMCLPPKELKVRWRRSNCWPRKFKTYLTGIKQPWPTRKFTEHIKQFVKKETSAEWHMWLKKGTGEMRATFFEFSVNVRNTIPTEQALDHKVKWEEYIASRNKVASVVANNAWGTSSLWVRAEADSAIKGSTGVTIVISVVSGFGGVLLFTMDICLSCYVVVLVVSIILGLAFFMVVMLGWALGPIEVIALVAFVGYAVTYTLHVAHHYCYAKPDDRPSPTHKSDKKKAKRALQEARTRIAIWKIGGAALGSAATTLGASIFLLFCTMRIFTKLGIVVCAVTILSVVFALAVFPALLMVAGPTSPPPMQMLKEFLHNRRHPGHPYESYTDIEKSQEAGESTPSPKAVAIQMEVDGEEEKVENDDSSVTVGKPVA